MTNLDENNIRFIFQLIKNHVDKQEKKIKDLQEGLSSLSTENEQLKRKMQELSKHAIIDSEGGDNGG